MMRRLLFTLGFLVAFTGVVEAQQEILRSDGRRTQVDTYLRALKTLHLPYGPTPTFDGGLQKEGSIFYNTTDNSLYIWDGSVWVQVAPDTDLSNYYTKPQTDSLLTYYATVQELNDGLALKVDKTTTINGYALSGNITLTAADVGALTKALADTYYKDINWVPAWEEITNKPSVFPPGPHTHPISQVDGLQDALDAKQATITGAASTITSADLTSDRALISSSTGKVAVSEVTSEELGYVSGVTSGVQGQIDNKVDKSTTITNTGGINIGGSLASGNVSLGLNETYLNNRYLRKDRNDGNDDYTLSVGKLVGDTVNASRLELGSLATTSENEYLVVDALGVVSKRTIDQMTFDVSNSGGTTQFSVGDQDQLRFQGTGDTQISFNAATKTIVINSVPGQGTGGVVTSVFGRDGGVVAEAGDYNTDLVTEGSNLYFTDGRVRSTELTGLTLSTSPITATDNVLQALGKAQGQINTRAASSRELEVSGTAGRVIVSGGAQDLTQNREWVVDLVASGVSVGTYPKVTVDAYGRVTAGSALVASDIPNLAAGKITSGTFDLARLATGTAAAGHYIDGGTGQWTPLPSADLTNYYTKIETDDLLDDKYDIPTGTTGQYVRGDGSLAAFPTIPQGTVTSVGISVPSNLLSVTGSPVTSSGTFNVTLPNRAANLVFAGPATGSAASPAFRSLVQNDIPALAISKVTGLQDALDGKEGAFSKGSLVAGDGVTLTGTLSNRLVGAGNVTISADIEEANLIAGDGISITGVYPDKTITNTAPNATHTGDVTGAEELTIANGVVTNAKLANVPTGTIKGRVTAGSGPPEDLTPSQVRALINVANGATANQTDAFLLNRANHTGEQAISTITGLATELGGKESLSNKTSNFNTLNNILYPTTQAVADYVSSQIPVAQELTTPALGQIGITGGNVITTNHWNNNYIRAVNAPPGSDAIDPDTYFRQSGVRWGGFRTSYNTGAWMANRPFNGFGGVLSFNSSESSGPLDLQLYYKNHEAGDSRIAYRTNANTGWSPWLEIATLDKTVNMSGNQTGIAGNKTATGNWTFNNQLIMDTSSPLNTPQIYLKRSASDRWTIGIGGGEGAADAGGNFVLFSQGTLGNNLRLAISRANGAITIPNLSGTGGGIVGVTSSGTLTRRPESDVIQTLSLGALAGEIGISGGNSVTLPSLGDVITSGFDSFSDFASSRPFGFHPFRTPSGGIPGLSSQTSYGILAKRLGSTSASGTFGVFKENTNTDKLFYLYGNSAGNYLVRTFASEEWANASFIGVDNSTGAVVPRVGGYDFSIVPTFSNVISVTGTATNRPSGATTNGIVQNYINDLGFGVQLYNGGASDNQDNYFYRVITTGGSLLNWFRVASREWVTAQNYATTTSIGDGTLSLATGTGLTGSASFSANQSTPSTFTVGVDAGYKLPTTAEWGAKAEIGTDSGQVRSNADLDARYLQTGDNISELVNDLSYTTAGSNITLFNNNAGYIVGGTAADQVRTNADLDVRYLQSETDPTVPQYVKDIASADISNWNSKLSSIVAGTGISIDATDPYNPVISSDAQELTFTGDVTGNGTGTIELTLADDSVNTRHIADTAVTTDKIRDGAVTLDKVQNIERGKLIGLGGITSNPWVSIAVYPNYSGWASNNTYPVNHVVFTGTPSAAYRAKTSVPVGQNPPDHPEYWEYIGPYRVTYNPSTAYDAGDVVIYPATATAYQTTSNVVGLAPDETPPSDPGAPVEITLDNTLSLGLDNVLRVNQSTTSIAGLIIGGENVTITGGGTTGNPFIINSTGGGGSGGSTTLAGLTDVTLSSLTSGQYLRYNGVYWENSAGYTLPVASASVLGGVKQGPGISIAGDGTISATGVTPSVFTRSVDGLVPAPGGSGTTRYLREDGTWAAPSGSGGGITALTGDVLASGSGSVPATIANGAVSNTKMANMPANTFKGRIGSNGSPQDLGAYASNKILNTSIELSTGVSNPDHNKNYMDLSSGGNFILTDVYLGMEYQLELKNVGGSDINISFIAVDNYDVVFPDGVDSTIPVGKTAVFSFSVFRSGTIRATKVIYSN